jgi:hypothetical protein
MAAINLTRELTADGFSHSELARLARSGELQRIRRGAYVTGTAEQRDAEERHRQLLEAVLRQSSSDAVVSHASAALVHGLPVFADELERVHLTRERRSGGRVRRGVHLHITPLDPDEITVLGGVAVTSLARTTVDVGRSVSHLKAVAMGDAALALGLRPAELILALSRASRRKGVGAARRMAAFCDGRSESVGESMSRVVLHQQGLPRPELQYNVYDGPFLVGRSDFCWEEQRTLGEFDGKTTYGRLLKPGRSMADVLYDEKRREDAMRDLGWQMVRWTFEDLWRPQALAERLERGFVRGRRS